MFGKIKIQRYLVTSFIFSTAIFSQFSSAEMISSAEKDVLSQISSAITQIDDRIKNHRLFVTPAKMDWPEMTKFHQELMFVLAHDPHGPPNKDLPAELHPSFLSGKLKGTWNKLEVSAYEIGDLAKDPIWISLKTDIELFFQHRENFMYQPARSIIRSPEFKQKLETVRQYVFEQLKSQSGSKKDVTIKVMDPFIEKMGAELQQLNQSILQLKEFRTPKPVENPSIFQSKYSEQLTLFAAGTFLAGLFMTFSFIWLKEKFKKAPVEVKPEMPAGAFNYYEWVKHLEGCLQQVKDREDAYREDLIKLKEMAEELRDARKKLNLADTQQEFYNSLDLLNATSAKFEDYCDKESSKKNVETSRKLINHMIKLCEAVETKKEIHLNAEKPRLKLVKSETQRAA